MNSGNRGLLSGYLQSAARFPERPALEVAKRAYTYRELSALASGCAAAMDARESAGGPPLTAVFASRTPYQFAGIVAALMRGHGYVPLNRSYPSDRTQFMIRQTGCRSIVVDRESAKQLPAVLAGIEYPLAILLPEETDVSELRRAFPLHTFLGADDCRAAATYEAKTPDENSIAYIIFTSGSTGVPKGVMVSHRNIRALLDFLVPRFEITERDRLSQTYAVTFDPSVLDMFLGWERGACCCCPSQQALLNPGAFINKAKITIWNSVPSVAIFMKRLGSLKKGNLPTLRLSIFGGEPLPVAVARDWMEAAPNSAIENLYGPTELAIVGTYYRWDPEKSPGECLRDTVPIGYPVPALSPLVCDERCGKSPTGAEGELLMTGAQVTLGYLGEPEKTRKAFVVPPGRNERILPDRRPRASAGGGRSDLLRRPHRLAAQDSRASRRARRGRSGDTGGNRHSGDRRRRLAPHDERRRRHRGVRRGGSLRRRRDKEKDCGSAPRVYDSEEISPDRGDSADREREVRPARAGENTGG